MGVVNFTLIHGSTIQQSVVTRATAVGITTGNPAVSAGQYSAAFQLCGVIGLHR